jgi:hypothetical protein
MSFFPGDASAPLPDEALRGALATVQGLAPRGARVEVRALDSTYIDMIFTDSTSAPAIKLDDGDMPEPFSPAVATIWFDDAMDNVEQKAQQTAKAVHEALKARGTGTFDTRCHLDLTDGTMPPLQAVIFVFRRPDMDRDTFIQYFRTHHVPLAKSLSPRFTRYTTNRLLEALGEFTADCVTLQEHPSYDAWVDHVNTRQQESDTALDDIGNFNRRNTTYIGQRNFT